MRNDDDRPVRAGEAAVELAGSGDVQLVQSSTAGSVNDLIVRAETLIRSLPDSRLIGDAKPSWWRRGAIATQYAFIKEMVEREIALMRSIADARSGIQQDQERNLLSKHQTAVALLKLEETARELIEKLKRFDERALWRQEIERLKHQLERERLIRAINEQRRAEWRAEQAFDKERGVKDQDVLAAEAEEIEKLYQRLYAKVSSDASFHARLEDLREELAQKYGEEKAAEIMARVRERHQLEDVEGAREFFAAEREGADGEDES